MVIKDKAFKKVADGVKPDEKKRLVLKKIKIDEGISYHIYINRQGQILLDPQVTIPASEAWLFKNPKALADVRQGLLESSEGEIYKIDTDAL